MQRLCPCGRMIAGKRDLCNECLNIYGADRREWPAWLLYMVNDFHNCYRKELDYLDYVSGFCDEADGGDEDELFQQETYVDADGEIILRGCEDCE